MVGRGNYIVSIITMPKCIVDQQPLVFPPKPIQPKEAVSKKKSNSIG